MWPSTTCVSAAGQDGCDIMHPAGSITSSIDTALLGLQSPPFENIKKKKKYSKGQQCFLEYSKAVLCGESLVIYALD